jgi:hypothetical protein
MVYFLIIVCIINHLEVLILENSLYLIPFCNIQGNMFAVPYLISDWFGIAYSISFNLSQCFDSLSTCAVHLNC